MQRYIGSSYAVGRGAENRENAERRVEGHFGDDLDIFNGMDRLDL